MEDNQLQGIDVSKYQKTVDWQAVRQSGVTFAFARATYGKSQVDGQFAANWQGMKDAGVVRGAYHFYVIGTDPTAQAELFLETVTSPGDLAPVLDLEEQETSGPMPSPTALAKDVQTWLDKVQKETTRAPLIYTNASFWNASMPSTFGAYPLWVAHWGVKTPLLPKGWSTWAFWQYSNKGSVAGVNGYIDLDVSNGPLQDYLATGS